MFGAQFANRVISLSTAINLFNIYIKGVAVTTVTGAVVGSGIAVRDRTSSGGRLGITKAMDGALSGAFICLCAG